MNTYIEFKVVPHVVDEIRHHHRYCWNLAKLLYKECAIGIKFLFNKVIRNGDVTAPPSEHAENPQRGA